MVMKNSEDAIDRICKQANTLLAIELAKSDIESGCISNVEIDFTIKCNGSEYKSAISNLNKEQGIRLLSVLSEFKKESIDADGYCKEDLKEKLDEAISSFVCYARECVKQRNNQ